MKSKFRYRAFIIVFTFLTSTLLAQKLKVFLLFVHVCHLYE